MTVNKKYLLNVRKFGTSFFTSNIQTNFCDNLKNVPKIPIDSKGIDLIPRLISNTAYILPMRQTDRPFRLR